MFSILCLNLVVLAWKNKWKLDPFSHGQARGWHRTTISSKYSPMYQIPRIWAPWDLWSPLGPKWNMTKSVHISCQMEFIWFSNHENCPSSLPDICHNNLVLVDLLPCALRASWPIFYPRLKLVQQTKFPVNLVKTFLQKRRKPIFWLILALFGVKRCPKIWPHVSIFYTPLKGNSNELKDKFNANSMESFGEIDENLACEFFWPYSGSQRTQKWPLESVFYTLLKLVSRS